MCPFHPSDSNYGEWSVRAEVSGTHRICFENKKSAQQGQVSIYFDITTGEGMTEEFAKKGKVLLL